MSLFNKTDKSPGSNTGQGAGAIVGMLLKQGDGVEGLLAKFKSNGLGEIVQSWISRASR